MPALPLADGLLSLPMEEVPSGQRWRLREERRLDPNHPASGSYQRTTGWRVSTADPDATPMRIGGGTRLGYHHHYVVGGKARIVLAALITSSNVMENQPMRDLPWRVRFRRKLRPRQVTGDTTYGTLENIVAIEGEGIRAYVPLPDFDRRTPFLGKGAFSYDADLDAYGCPGGSLLRPLKHADTQPTRIYRAPAAACDACPLKARCTTSRRGRRVRRSVDEAYLDRVRAYHATEAYQKAMRKRQVWVEPLFAEAKGWHGLRRFRLRGLENVNLKRWLAETGWWRRHGPCGSLVALSKQCLRAAAACG